MSSNRAAIGLFVVFAAAAFALVTSHGARRSVPDQAAGTRVSAGAPLELVALEHERDADRFIVRGIVRNSTASSVEGLTAAVSVFGPDGGLITSGHASVAAPRLAPGEETPFVVIVSNTASVDRYHLSFRTASGVVPHLDRRARGVLDGLS